jgi:hypothetical protein
VDLEKDGSILGGGFSEEHQQRSCLCCLTLTLNGGLQRPARSGRFEGCGALASASCPLELNVRHDFPFPPDPRIHAMQS